MRKLVEICSKHSAIQYHISTFIKVHKLSKKRASKENLYVGKSRLTHSMKIKFQLLICDTSKER